MTFLLRTHLSILALVNLLCYCFSDFQCSFRCCSTGHSYYELSASPTHESLIQPSPLIIEPADRGLPFDCVLPRYCLCARRCGRVVLPVCTNSPSTVQMVLAVSMYPPSQSIFSYTCTVFLTMFTSFVRFDHSNVVVGTRFWQRRCWTLWKLRI